MIVWGGYIQGGTTNTGGDIILAQTVGQPPALTLPPRELRVVPCGLAMR